MISPAMSLTISCGAEDDPDRPTFKENHLAFYFNKCRSEEGIEIGSLKISFFSGNMRNAMTDSLLLKRVNMSSSGNILYCSRVPMTSN